MRLLWLTKFRELNSGILGKLTIFQFLIEILEHFPDFAFVEKALRQGVFLRNMLLSICTWTTPLFFFFVFVIISRMFGPSS